MKKQQQINNSSMKLTLTSDELRFDFSQHAFAARAIKPFRCY